MSGNVLVIAFDGLDRELIDKYGLEAIRQEEFGNIDNESGLTEKKTQELFASFITGSTHEEHGVKGHGSYITESWKKTVINTLTPGVLVRNVRGFNQ